MLKWLIFSINVKTTNQSHVNGWQGSSPWAETFHVATSTCYLRATPVLSFVTTVPVVSVDPGSHFKVLLHIVHMLACACILTRLHCRQLRPVHRTGRLLARAGCVSLCMGMCFCAEVFFSVLTLYSMEHSLGVTFFFLLPFLMLCCNFLQFPVVLSTPLYVCYVWAGWWLISLVLVTKWQ